MSADHLKAHQFKAGASGNAGGRPSVAKALAGHGKTTSVVVAMLVKRCLDVLEDPKASERMKEYAHTWLTNYILGKPKQTVEHSGHIGSGARDLTKMTREELLELASDLDREDDEDDQDVDGTAGEAQGADPR